MPLTSNFPSNSDMQIIDAAIEGKVDKVEGKGLSTNDYTNEDKEKLNGIHAGATKVEASETNGNIKVNDVETEVYQLPDTVLHTTDIQDVVKVTKGAQMQLPEGFGEGPYTIIVDEENDGENLNDSNGMPSGGTSGQVLAKLSNDDFNAGWIDSPNLIKLPVYDYNTEEECNAGILSIFNSMPVNSQENVIMWIIASSYLGSVLDGLYSVQITKLEEKYGIIIAMSYHGGHKLGNTNKIRRSINNGALTNWSDDTWVQKSENEIAYIDNLIDIDPIISHIFESMTDHTIGYIFVDLQNSSSIDTIRIPSGEYLCKICRFSGSRGFIQMITNTQDSVLKMDRSLHSSALSEWKIA